MGERMSQLVCPVCATELTLEHLVIDADNRAAVAQLLEVALPIGARLLQYTRLFAPAKTSLTQRKQVRLLMQLLPDLKRGGINHRGRDWAVPMAAWAQALDQMLALRDAGKLDLPMKGHGYLYAILVSLADRDEAVQEVQAEAAKRQPLAQLIAGQGAANAAPMPANIRAQIATLKNLGVKK
jgi:hypothetical protein